MGAPQRGSFQYEILKLLKEHPEGLDINQIRELLNLGKTQQHLDRRVRELDPFYIIQRVKHGRRTVYVYVGEREGGEWGFGKISKTNRAKIYIRYGYQCQMCGRTVSSDKIRLHIDHKIPVSWGGTNMDENLWTLCSVCNEGKKNYFSSFNPELMKKVMAYSSVHERIARLLKLKFNEWVDCDLIAFVANFNDHQTDWRKRLRELRYLGLEIEFTRKKVEKRTISYYKLTKWVKLPENPSQAARDYEQERAKNKRTIE